MNEPNTKLNTIGKAISIFEMIRSAKQPLSIKEIAETLGLNKSSIHHHIKTLTEFGYLQQDPATRKYDIGLNLVSVGQAYLQRLNVRERGHAYIEELGEALNETVHMLVLDNDKAVYVDKIDAYQHPGSLKCSSYIGLRAELFSTASGKVLLTHKKPDEIDDIIEGIEFRPITKHTYLNANDLREDLALTKERGYGLDLEENSLGQVCIAVPIYNMHSQCVAAISVSCTLARIPREVLEGEIYEKLKATGNKISLAMGYVPGE